MRRLPPAVLTELVRSTRERLMSSQCSDVTSKNARLGVLGNTVVVLKRNVDRGELVHDAWRNCVRALARGGENPQREHLVRARREEPDFVEVVRGSGGQPLRRDQHHQVPRRGVNHDIARGSGW